LSLQYDQKWFADPAGRDLAYSADCMGNVNAVPETSTVAIGAEEEIMVSTTVLFDMRGPEFGAKLPELYAAALEMVAFADKSGIDRVWIAEHHGAEDNYIPTPFVLGGAFAARSKSIRITLNAVVLPLHDPVKIAEQIGVLDQISNGRLEVVFAAGYVKSEFDRFGVALSDRGRLLDDGIALILRALSGERFEANGREVFVRPLPVQPLSKMFYTGGGVAASARRAARFNLGFVPMKRDLFAVYEAECARLGHDSGRRLGPYGPISIHVAADPEAEKAKLERHILHHGATYAKWAAEGSTGASNYTGMEDPEVVWKSGRYPIVTPDQCVALVEQLERTGASCVMQPLIAGLAPEIGWRSLELFVSAVLPRIKALKAAA
jgi:alkanesulfonate monooxygenase SsuD/methylene tetrahydromethanopterin reductase-like flavin-dependent oxidoreductase (luciferase family)